MLRDLVLPLPACSTPARARRLRRLRWLEGRAMAGTTPARARADYDYLIKLRLIGDSGVGKSCLLLRFSDDSFITSFITTIGIDVKIRTIELDSKRIKLQIWDTAGQERFRTMNTDIRNWIRNIEQHASDNVNKILVGNKADMDESKRAVPTAKGQALADEYGIQFFETLSYHDIKKRLSETDSKPEDPVVNIKPGPGSETSPSQALACCGS
ncbi:hypothetical protein EJB05_18684 [Eragrostis curvula]|uniref:Uncharacterized protein n=1 Tax=Eragrostis curvula TaxID=38414 RepID=A0A5J9VLU0_9POAL|nr:hypothetical protein EJB05_18684 [Eragrostis curvula]